MIGLPVFIFGLILVLARRINVIRLPVVVSAPNDVLIFKSLEEAARYIEPIDVQNNEYLGYDANGRLLKFSVELVDKRPRIVIHSAEDEPTHSKELAEALTNFLSAAGVDRMELEAATLDALIAKGIEYQ